ncbi:TrbK entry exclusion during conjugation protein (plasmid) [Azotobacter chroococcum NCIMB 8003]|uniref:TrbK entry exclusion during conjugation protein n=2 Tax=Azotobacter group TaxID=351 RepID=A0A0C4WX25_9GAMM|nr:TrbK entry exclusion during conjugation protein [Azotobacter chroococcum NCIMB 8003]
MKYMYRNTYLGLLMVTGLAGLLSACFQDQPKEAMPTIDAENCKPENIAKIKDSGTRQKFSSLCLRHGGDYKPSEKREW